MRRNAKIDLVIVLVAVAFGAIGYKTRMYLDKQFEALVSNKQVTIPGSLGAFVTDAMTEEDKKNAPPKKKVETPRQKKARLKKEEAKKRGKIIHHNVLAPASFDDIASDPKVTLAGQDQKRGLRGEYYNGTNFEELMLVRVDRKINFSWGNKSPHKVISKDNFSVRWTGWIKPNKTANYKFCTVTDDGVRLWIDGKKIIDQWRGQAPTAVFGKIQLTRGKSYPIKMEYYEGPGGAVAKLYWVALKK